MIKKIGKAFLRIEHACAAFLHVLKTGGINVIKVSQVQKDDALSGKNIVITGGSSGIGLAIAKKSIEAGAKVVITGRNEEKLKQAVSDLGSQHAGYVLWDITDSAQADDKVAQCVDYFGGRVDAVVNNAGIQPHEFFPNVSVSEWNRVYETNSQGTFFVSQAFCKYWMQASSGCYRHLINISSQGGFVGATYPYRMSKWDIRGLTAGLGLQMAPYGVLVNGVAPGVVKTSMQSFALEQGNNTYCKQNPLERVALPEEIAEFIVFMLSDACNFMVGQTVVLDGGYSLKN